jgi:hypothetical protein
MVTCRLWLEDLQLASQLPELWFQNEGYVVLLRFFSMLVLVLAPLLAPSVDIFYFFLTFRFGEWKRASSISDFSTRSQGRLE